MNITNAVKGKILASVNDPDEAHAVLDLFDTIAETAETLRIQNEAIAKIASNLAIARDENAALRQRIAELEAAAIFGTEAPTDD